MSQTSEFLLFFNNFIRIIFLAVFAENILFTRGLDPGRVLRNAGKKHSRFLKQSLILMGVLFLTSVFMILPYQLLRSFTERFAFLPLIYLVFISLSYFLVYFIGIRFFPKSTIHFDKDLTAATFNCALIGSLLLAMQNDYSLPMLVAFCLGMGLGYMLANLMVTEGLRRLALADVPKPFRGLPISLIYIGILSLSLYGLTGFWVA